MKTPNLTYILFFAFLLTNCNQMNTPNEVKLVIDAKAKLGEGALWDYNNKRLFWVDINSELLNIYYPETDTNRVINLGQKVGTVVPVDDNQVLVALEDGIYSLDLQTEELIHHVSPEDTSLNNRFNDGKCDPAGRFWVGTMSGNKRNGGLYRVDPDFSSYKMIDSVRVSNGIAWSLDNTKMYYIDTPTRQVTSFNYNHQTGEISNPQVAVQIPDTLGHPDGSTLDSEGKLWIAMWGGSSVTRWDPETGEYLGKIEVPAKNVTSVAFGGSDLKTMYITSASGGMKDEDWEKYPHAGGLFSVRPGSKGIPCSYFGKGMPENN
jgi:sugar lactone lactonase YvrE